MARILRCLPLLSSTLAPATCRPIAAVSSVPCLGQVGADRHQKSSSQPPKTSQLTAQGFPLLGLWAGRRVLHSALRQHGATGASKLPQSERQLHHHTALTKQTSQGQGQALEIPLWVTLSRQRDEPGWGRALDRHSATPPVGSASPLHNWDSGSEKGKGREICPSERTGKVQRIPLQQEIIGRTQSLGFPRCCTARLARGHCGRPAGMHFDPGNTPTGDTFVTLLSQRGAKPRTPLFPPVMKA